jgi:dihydropteroate synthase
MNAYKQKITPWKLRSRTLELGRRTLVMGIVNVTPDSFSDGGLFFDTKVAVAHAMQLLDEGADILDLGAESTRPGSHAGGASGTPSAPAVSAEEEAARLLPVLEGILRERPDALISVDTYKSATAQAALQAGAEIVNDVSGFLWDPEMAQVCAEAGCGVVLMHTRGRPEQWRTLPHLEPDAMLATVRDGLTGSLRTAAAAGISPEAIVLDPGYGFGKRFEENFSLLARQAELLQFGRPLLAGLSRKLFLGRTLAALHDGADAPPEARETASVAAQVVAILHGASIVRVHAVRPAVEAARIADAVLAAE